MTRPAPIKSTFGQPDEAIPASSTALKSTFVGRSSIVPPASVESGTWADAMQDLSDENIDDLRAAEDGATLLHALAVLLERAGAVSYSLEARTSAEAIERIAKMFPEADVSGKGEASDGDAGIADNVRELRLALGVDY
ncbi:hypothetical protein [Paeniglutamicibacter kerguelensis]|uniref:Uncharacterized protein n=1 Tax=Paeniglutamicibacter kerguelensis TaxID=254788 RepID=A0ABS4XI29_9MICC|nr:hypothetical protein [Paeniglutamicibacter kerguelensis]MBP2387971.1 hypothetical protein [Paeniglutamicibacter kerguelensis]